MILSVCYFVCYFAVFGFLLYRWLGFHPKVQGADQQPTVAILVAVRNEEQNIIRCLQAISQLDYPGHKLEVLIGDDGSTDNTFNVVQDFIRDKPNYGCLKIKGNLGYAKAKANVVAHLAKETQADYLAITDADIKVPQTWLKAMLAPMQEASVGVVSGVTTIRGNSWFAKLQALDWVFSLGLIQVLAELPRPVTALGNNMMVRRKAYESIGGFESIPHSITEDVQLFSYLKAKGWQSVNLYQPQTLAYSQPAHTFAQVLQQRKRWMTGSMHLPWYAVCTFVLHASFYVFLLTSAYYISVLVMGLLAAAKLSLQAAFIRRGLQRLKLPYVITYVVFFEVYLFALSVILIPFYYLPVKIDWKGRKYSK